MLKILGVLIAAMLAAQAPPVALAQTNSSNRGSAASDTSGASVELHIREGLDAARRSEWATAIERFTQAHLLAPDNPVPLYNLGLAHMSADHPTAAIAWWEAYLAAAPGADNADRVRGEIQRLQRVAIETARAYFEAAWTGIPQLSGPARQSQRWDIERHSGQATPVFGTEVNDSMRVAMATWLREMRAPSAALTHLEAVLDTSMRNRELEAAATTLAEAREFAEARRYAGSITDETRRSAAVAKIAEAEEVARADSVIDAQLSRRQYPAAQIASFMTRSENHAPGGYMSYALFTKLVQRGFHAEAAQIASQVATTPQREQLLADIAAAKLRTGDIGGASAHAREILDRAALPRDEIMRATEAINRVDAGEFESALRIVTSQMSDSYGLRGPALAAIARGAKQRGDTALAERAEQIRRGVGTRPDVNPIVAALAISEDYDAALALAAIADPDWLFLWVDRYDTSGAVIDLLSESAGLEAGYAKVAFVATLRGNRRAAQRAVDLAKDPVLRYFVHRNVAWAHTVAGRYSQAMEDVEGWPRPQSDNRSSELSYHASRAQALAAVAVHAARAGRFEHSRRALAAMPAVTAVPGRGVAFAVIAAYAAMNVGDAYSAAGDAASSRQLYEIAAEALHAYFTNASVVLASNAWFNGDDRLISRATERLLRSYPGAADRIAPRQRADIAAWSRAALVVSGEAPATLLRRLVERDARELPRSSAYAARRIVEDLMRLETVAPGRLKVPTGIEPPARDRAAAQAGTTPRPPQVPGTAAWRADPRISSGEIRSASWEPGDTEVNERYRDYWVYRGRAGERIVITATSDVGAAVTLGTRGPSDTVTWRVGASNPLTAVLPVTADYRIAVEAGYANRTGLYTLTVQSSQFIEAGGHTPGPGDASLTLNAKCEVQAARLRVGFSCPSGWTRTQWDGYKGTHVQVNYRHHGDLRINVNVQVLTLGVPAETASGSSVVYFNVEDFFRKTQAEVYGDRGVSAVEELALPNARWRLFSANVLSNIATNGPLGNLFPVDAFLETRIEGDFPRTSPRQDIPWNWADQLYPFIPGTRHDFAVAGFDQNLVVVTVSGPREVITPELIRAVAGSVTTSPPE